MRLRLGYTLLLIIFLSNSEIGLGQQPILDWANYFSCPGFNTSIPVTHEDADGNLIYVCGFNNQLDVAPQSGGSWLGGSLEGTKVAILKLDKSGNVLWSKALEGVTVPSISSAYYKDVRSDSEGNIYLTGRYTGTIDYDPGISQELSTQSSKTWFLLKLDTYGDFVWVKELTPLNSNANTTSLYIPSLEIDQYDDIYLGGSFGGIINFDPSGVFPSDTSSNWGGYTHDCFVAKYSSNGDFLWRNILGGHRTEHFYEMKLTNSEQLLIAGDFQDSIHLDVGGQDVFFETPGVFSSNNLFFGSLNLQGELLWVNQVYSSDAEVVVIDENEQGDLFLGGHFSNAINFTPPFSWTYIFTRDAMLNQDIQTDCFWVKFSQQGTVSEVHTFGGLGVDEFKAVASSPSNQSFIGGYLNHDSLFYDNQFIDPFSTPGADIILRTDAWGALIDFISLDAGWVTYGDFHIDAEGNFFGAGYFESGTDFNPAPGIQSTLEPNVSDVFLFRWDYFAALEEQQNQEFAIYPNPAFTELHVAFGSYPAEETLFGLYNSMGELMRIQVAKGGSISFDVRDIPAGIYYLKIQGGYNQPTRKVIIQH